VNHHRLVLGRKLRGFTKQELARRADVSPRSLTDFESGNQMPSLASKVQLARALRLPVEFLSGADPVEIPPEAVSFRALTRTTARQRDQAISSAAIAFDLASWIANRFALPETSVPQFPGIDPETAAQAVRGAWGLGEKPVSNMVHLLEAHGVLVFSLVEECREIDAFSVWDSERPYVFFNTTKSAEHGRMDAAHELGHLVLHHDPLARLRDRTAEHDAQKFAAAFLIPERSVRARANRNSGLADLIAAKRHWKVALSSLVVRMHALGLMSDWQYRTLFVTMSSRGFLKREPNSGARETSQILAKVLALLHDRDMTTRDIAFDLHVGVEVLNRLIFGLTLTPVEGKGEGGHAPLSTRRPSLRVI
jgi:Zn-dependent peptidase ImmA (M78 family)/DNA-binding XRE family transcriptional regulator